MSTLILHPKDSSTTFLNIIYESIPDKTIITGGVSYDELASLIKSHDRIMMMGHGSPYGLFSVGQFNNMRGRPYIIDENMVSLLQEKENNVYIWCNADCFVDKYQLKGFYSGMFISEVSEATYCGIFGTDQELINESNFGFCNIVAKYVNENKDIIHENVKKEYGELALENPVAYYNNTRLYKN